jgi:hypothetical protein
VALALILRDRGRSREAIALLRDASTAEQHRHRRAPVPRALEVGDRASAAALLEQLDRDDLGLMCASPSVFYLQIGEHPALRHAGKSPPQPDQRPGAPSRAAPLAEGGRRTRRSANLLAVAPERRPSPTAARWPPSWPPRRQGRRRAPRSRRR